MLENLKEYNKMLYKKQYVINLLHWELMINISPKGTNYLIDVLNEQELELFNLSTSEEYKKLLFDYLNNPNSDKSSDYYLIQKHNYDNLLKSERIPKEFLKKYNEICSKANKVWEQAKENNDYEMYKPYLREVIELTKEYYGYYEPNMNLYDAMLNVHERGMNQDILDKLFDELKQELIPLVQRVKKDKEQNKNYLQKYSTDELMKCAKVLLEYIGFDMERGTLGIYPHGFMEKMSSNDVRIAFAHKDDATSFVSTIIHEGGHGIFEQNTNEDISNEYIDLYALHESQSRFYENILGRNINFWLPIYDELNQMLKLDIPVEEFVSALNNVHSGLIRINADELTYALHIIIRYEIEKEIFNGNLNIDDLEIAWNNKMKEYLGLEVTKASEGLMQDMHWSEGAFGYFPSYLIGNIYDGMFKETIEEKLGNIDEILASGRIKEITKFLNENIHIHGSAYDGLDVVRRVCDKEISVKPLIKYFKSKYE